VFEPETDRRVPDAGEPAPRPAAENVTEPDEQPKKRRRQRRWWDGALDAIGTILEALPSS
jgi:hypothetical protein